MRQENAAIRNGSRRRGRGPRFGFGEVRPNGRNDGNTAWATDQDNDDSRPPVRPIARELGLSPSKVSEHLSGKRGVVSRATAERIDAAFDRRTTEARETAERERAEQSAELEQQQFENATVVVLRALEVSP